MSAKEKAIELRKMGYSYGYIAQKTRLSKSTLSYHLSKIPFTPNKETIDAIGKARAAAAVTKAKKKAATIANAKVEAKREIGELSKRDVLLLGLGLYIGEGSKTQDLVRLVNANPKVIKLFIQWIKIFGVDDKNIGIRIHLYPESNIMESEKFWLKTTGLPSTSLQRACIDRRTSKNKERKNTWKHGTAHVTIRAKGNKRLGTKLARKISAYMEEVLQ